MLICQQVLKDGKIKIEHHCEQSICDGQNQKPDRRLDYTNLFAVCLGNGPLHEGLHCDTQKASFSIDNGLPIALNPSIQAHTATISYSSTGLLKSSNQVYSNELNQQLNLNIPYLKKMRSIKWLNIFKFSKTKTGTINKAKMKRLLSKELTQQNGSFSENFPGMSAYLLKKFT